MGKRMTLFSNMCIAIVLVGLSVVVFTADISGMFLTVSAPVHNGNRNNQNISIMFNVFKGDQYVAPILDLLEQRGVQATFFLGGAWVSRNMVLTQRMGENFEIGNHSFTQADMRTMSIPSQRAELENTRHIIHGVTGVTTNLFAPPGGSFGRNTLRVAESLGYTTIMWSRDTIDWRDHDAELVFTRATTNIMNGDLILMHPTAHTLVALPKILYYYQSRGFNVTRVSETIS
ncbi:MAG: polysaccharide deacetylase family protein [Firmicutes bacterium]|nr:polysaccharide deacetylase family protein [Bacillota bacterium]